MRNKLTVILAALFAIAVFVAIRQTIQRDQAVEKLDRFKSTEISMEESLREIEVSLWETANALMYYLNEPAAISSEELETQIQDIDKFLPRYKGLLQSAEKRQAIAEFEKIWTPAVIEAHELIRLRDELTVGLNAIREAVLEADSIIDFKIRTAVPETSDPGAGDLSRLRLSAVIEEGLWQTLSAVVGFSFDGSAMQRNEVEKHVMEVSDELRKYAALSLGEEDKRNLEELTSSWLTIKKRLDDGMQIIASLHVKTLHFWEQMHAADDIIDFKLQRPVAPIDQEPDKG